jgi:D-tyrosyl-tRNA(Tyr) deacylase
MIAVVQRVTSASVTVGDRIVGQIGRGMLVLAAVEASDTPADIERSAARLVAMRIFQNGDKNFDLDIKQSGGSILLVSNFTVAADTSSGRRPSLSNAAPPEKARELFDLFVQSVRSHNVTVETGEFAADMQVALINDGPVTFLLRQA